MSEFQGEAVKYGFKERARRFYRGTLFQAIIVGLVSFTQPGIWNALNSLGGGGEASPTFVNISNAITFAIMVFFSPFCGIIGNKIGLKWVLAFGTLGYVPYSAALYCNSVFGTQWFLLFGAVTCGFSASALWTSEAAIAVGYPEADRRGFYISIWLTLNKLGSVISGAIQLGINANGSEKGSVSPKTYLVLVALQCLGLPLSFLLSPPEKLIREDGRKPMFANSSITLKQGTKNFFHLFKRKEIVLLLPIFISAQWLQTYNGNFLAAYFTVRSRALASFVISIVGMITCLLVGRILDIKSTPRSLRAKISWTTIATLFISSFIWSFIIQANFQSHDTDLDWNSEGFGRGAGSYVWYRIAYEAVGVWMYWILGTYDVSVDTLALTTGLLRSCESLGSAFSYAVGAVKSASLMTNLIVGVVLFVVAMPMCTWAAWLVPDALEEGSDTEGSVEEIVEEVKV